MVRSGTQSRAPTRPVQPAAGRACCVCRNIRAMGKYGKKVASKVGRALHEMKAGTLRSGSGKKVRSRKQAIAIGLSQAREAGARVPPRHK